MTCYLCKTVNAHSQYLEFHWWKTAAQKGKKKVSQGHSFCVCRFVSATCIKGFDQAQMRCRETYCCSKEKNQKNLFSPKILSYV